MIILTTLLFMLISSAAVLGIYYFTGFDVLTFKFFFILPIGSLFSMILATYGIGLGLKIHGIKMQKVTGRVFLLGILLFFALQYSQYMMTTVDETGAIANQMVGDHISEYMNPDTGEAFTFTSYTKYMTEHASISFFRRSRSLFSIKGNGFVNYTFYVIDVLGAALGALAGASMVVGSLTYCDECKKYMSRIHKGRVNDLSVEVHQTFRTAMQEKQDIRPLLNAYPATQNKQGPIVYDIMLNHCEACEAGVLEEVYYVRNDKDKYEEKKDKAQKFEASPAMVKALL